MNKEELLKRKEELEKAIYRKKILIDSIPANFTYDLYHFNLDVVAVIKIGDVDVLTISINRHNKLVRFVGCFITNNYSTKDLDYNETVEFDKNEILSLCLVGVNKEINRLEEMLETKYDKLKTLEEIRDELRG